jgi:hypothetical protein
LPTHFLLVGQPSPCLDEALLILQDLYLTGIRRLFFQN